MNWFSHHQFFCGTLRSTGNCPHFIWYASAKKKKMKKKFRHPAKLSNLKMATLSVEAVFISCQHTRLWCLLPFPYATTRTRPEMANSEFNKLHKHDMVGVQTNTISAVGRRSEEDRQFKASLGYTGGFCFKRKATFQTVCKFSRYLKWTQNSDRDAQNDGTAPKLPYPPLLNCMVLDSTKFILQTCKSQVQEVYDPRLNSGEVLKWGHDRCKVWLRGSSVCFGPARSLSPYTKSSLKIQSPLDLAVEKMARQESLSRRSGARPHLPDLEAGPPTSTAAPGFRARLSLHPGPLLSMPLPRLPWTPHDRLGGGGEVPDCMPVRSALWTGRRRRARGPPGRGLMASLALPPAAAF